MMERCVTLSGQDHKYEDLLKGLKTGFKYSRTAA